MFNVHVEMPSGAISRGYDRKTEESAIATFTRIVSQIKMWSGFIGHVVAMDEDKSEFMRVNFDAA